MKNGATIVHEGNNYNGWLGQNHSMFREYQLLPQHCAIQAGDRTRGGCND